MLGELLELSDLQLRKKLLVAESELNRQLLQKEMQRLKVAVGTAAAAGLVLELLVPKPNGGRDKYSKSRPLWQKLALFGWSLYKKMKR